MPPRYFTISDQVLWYAAICTANLASVACCYTLLQRLRQLHERVSQNTFLQVLRALTIADIFMHLALLTVTLTVPDDFGFFLFMSSIIASRRCVLPNFVNGIFKIFRLISIFLESNIALLFMVQAFRTHRLLRRWISTVYSCSIFGALLGFLATLLSPFSDSIDATEVHHGCQAKVKDWVTVVALLAAAKLALVAYVITLYRSCKASPGSVQQASLRRAAIYPLNFLISFGIFLYVTLFDVGGDWAFLAVCLESLNGILNTATYIVQSRHAVHLRAAAISDRTEVGHQTSAGNQTSTGRRNSSRPASNVGSFNVAIGEVEVVEIPERSFSDETMQWGFQRENESNNRWWLPWGHTP